MMRMRMRIARRKGKGRRENRGGNLGTEAER